MNKREKELVEKLRTSGESYSKIADRLGISKNTIQSYCRRNNIGDAALTATDIDDGGYCKKCGEPLKQTQGKKVKLFCSDKCRMGWWNAHPHLISHKSVRTFTCQTCGKSFEGFGKGERKYCSRTCYTKSRVVRRG